MITPTRAMFPGRRGRQVERSKAARSLAPTNAAEQPDPAAFTFRRLAQLISAFEAGARQRSRARNTARSLAEAIDVPVLGITGTGGAGKSSLTDELIRRFRLDQGDALTIAVIAIDPSRRKSGGALLGDRIRMNAIGDWGGGARVYMRSLATREHRARSPRRCPTCSPRARPRASI